MKNEARICARKLFHRETLYFWASVAKPLMLKLSTRALMFGSTPLRVLTRVESRNDGGEYAIISNHDGVVIEVQLLHYSCVGVLARCS